jgi:hypothetical protein
MRNLWWGALKVLGENQKTVVADLPVDGTGWNFDRKSTRFSRISEKFTYGRGPIGCIAPNFKHDS